MNQIQEAIIEALHQRCGYCGHCGKKKCGGKKENSRLPDKLKTDDVLWAIEEGVKRD